MSPRRASQVRKEPAMPMRIACGAAAGAMAAAPMAVVMEVLRRALPPVVRDPLPPRRVAIGLARKLRLARHPNRAERERLTWASHFAYGAGTGAGYGVLDPALGKALPHPAARGAAFGLAVWLLSYFGWLPAAGITSPQFRRPLRRNTTLALSHLVWGVTTGLLTDRMTHPPAPRGAASPPQHHPSRPPPTRRAVPRKQSVSAT